MDGCSNRDGWLWVIALHDCTRRTHLACQLYCIDDTPRKHLIAQFLLVGCSSWRPTNNVKALRCRDISGGVKLVTLKMHDLKITDKENYVRHFPVLHFPDPNLRALAFLCWVCWRCGCYAIWLSAVLYTYWHGYACVFLMCIWRTIVRHFSN